MSTQKKLTGKRIPIADAKAIGDKNGYSQVIIVAWDDQSGTTSVVTWGKTLEQCDQAAKGGNRVKRALNWPEELCDDKPARIRRKESEESPETPPMIPNENSFIGYSPA